MFSKILLAVDGSAPSGRAAEKAKDLAEGLHAEVIVLHVREHEVIPWAIVAVELETPAEADDLVDGYVRTLKDAGIGARGELRDTLHGHVAREILQASRDVDADMIVMGSRGLSDLAGLVLGSEAHKVLHLADRPVLIVR